MLWVVCCALCAPRVGCAAVRVVCVALCVVMCVVAWCVLRDVCCVLRVLRGLV